MSSEQIQPPGGAKADIPPPGGANADIPPPGGAKADGQETDGRDDMSEQMRIRLDKYQRLIAEPDRAPFPAGVARTHNLAQIRSEYPDLEPGAVTGHNVGTTGRVIFVRNSGKLCFATLREGGVELQIMLSADRVGAQALASWKADVDLGDQVFIVGEVISSRRGELSVLAESWRMTAKALRPLPVAHKLMSEDTRIRQRYVDLIVRPEARRSVIMRSEVLKSIRATLAGMDFVEVETPVLQVTHGGAAARPFKTHLNAFDQPMFLRIALELYLKRCVVGGLDRVYEIGRIFRNEGVDSTHSPEFTMLEAYEAYGDYHSVADWTRRLILDAADAVGVQTPRTADGTEIDLSAEWRWASIYELVSAAVNYEVTPDTTDVVLRGLADKGSIAIRPEWGAGDIVLEVYEKLVEHTLIQPTFVCDYPRAVRPLARQHRSDPRLAEAWDLIIGGVELAPGYTELADPVEQRRILTEQSLAAAAGDPEAMELDEDFLLALEVGMPPTGGMGLGVDRLIGLFSGRGIRETILFPLLKPL